MYGDCRRACVLYHPRQYRRVPILVRPSGTHLHRHRNVDGTHHRLDDARRVIGFAHQTAARIVLGNLGHGASHVDVHDVRPHVLHDPRSRRHLRRIAAKDLNRDGPFLLGVLGVLERAVDSSHQAFGRNHLGDDQTATAVSFDQTAKGRVGHAGHRRHDKRRRELD